MVERVKAATGLKSRMDVLQMAASVDSPGWRSQSLARTTQSDANDHVSANACCRNNDEKAKARLERRDIPLVYVVGVSLELLMDCTARIAVFQAQANSPRLSRPSCQKRGSASRRAEVTAIS